MTVSRAKVLSSLAIWIWALLFSCGTLLIASAQDDQAAPLETPQASSEVYDQPETTASNEPSNIGDSSTYDDHNRGRSYPNESDRNDPPGRAARLQYMNGSVSIQPRGTEDWVQGSVNRPLTIADNVWADKNSRAELNVGTGLIRIGSETSLTLTNVNDSSVQLSLHQGAMNLHIRHLYRGEIYEVDTPNQAFTILKTGDYRFDVDPNADTTLVTVWRGEGEATGQGRSVRIKEHQQAQFRSGNSLSHEIRRAPRLDGFDEWCQVRNRRTDDSVSARYVSPDVVGSEDLDAYGTWRRNPRYGSVWVPTQVDAEWAPYTTGHWAYIEPWGWTWVDDAPWGYAPFHYGRWIHEEGYWGWAPGPYYGGWERGYYAPALVAWFGGGGWGVNFGFGGGGGYGWCALGWGEPFVPWYHSGWGYFRNVNVYNTQIVNINNYRNVYVNNVYNNGGTGKPPYGGGGGYGGGGKPPYGGGGGYGSGKPPYTDGGGYGGGTTGTGKPPYGGGGGYANGGNKPPVGTGLHYANMKVPGAFTAVPSNTLERGLPVRQNAVRVSAGAIQSAPAVSRVNATPTLQSRLGPNAGRPAAAAPASAMSRPVMSNMTPPAASRPGMNQSGVSTKPSAGIPASGGQASTPPAISGMRNTPPSRSLGRISGAPNSSFESNNSMTGARNVPRPPSAGGSVVNSQPVRTANNQAPAAMNRGYAGGSFGGARSVPRPSANLGQANSGQTNVGRSSMSQSPVYPSNNRSVNQGGIYPSQRNPSVATSQSPVWSGQRSVPRPTGQVAPAPRSYPSGGSSAGSGRSYPSGNSSPSYSRGYPSGGSSPSYSRSYPSASSSGYPSRSGGGYGGGPQYSSPRNSSAPAYSRGNYGGAPYGGGRSAPPSGGGSYGGSYSGGSRGGYSTPARASSPAPSGGARTNSGGGPQGNHSGGRH